MRCYSSNRPGWEILTVKREAEPAMVSGPRPPAPPAPAPPNLLRRGWLRLPARLLVRLDGALEIPVLRARDEAERVERLQVLLGVGQVAEHQVRLADVLVRALVLGVDGERLLVDRDGGGRVAVLARRVGEPVVGIGVLGVTRGHALEERDRLRVLARLDRLHRGGVLGILGLGGGAGGSIAAPAPGRAGDAGQPEREHRREDTLEREPTKQCEHEQSLPKRQPRSSRDGSRRRRLTRGVTGEPGRPALRTARAPVYAAASTATGGRARFLQGVPGGYDGRDGGLARRRAVRHHDDVRPRRREPVDPP